MSHRVIELGPHLAHRRDKTAGATDAAAHCGSAAHTLSALLKALGAPSDAVIVPQRRLSPFFSTPSAALASSFQSHGR